MPSFAWTDPRTGTRYWGAQAGQMMVAYHNGTLGPAKSGPAPGSQSPAPTAPQPFDAGFEAQKQGATFNRQIGDAEAGYQTGRTAYLTGYNADGSRNASNPYAQAQLLEDSYRRSRTGTQNSMAAAGQLYSGARLNALARDDRQYAEQSASLRDRTMDAYHGLRFGQLQNYGSNSLGLSQADFEALRKATYGG